MDFTKISLNFTANKVILRFNQKKAETITAEEYARG